MEQKQSAMTLSMTFVAFQMIFNGFRVNKIHKYGFSMWCLHAQTRDFDDGILRLERALTRMCLSYFLNAHLNINLGVFNRLRILCSLIFVHTQKTLLQWASHMGAYKSKWQHHQKFCKIYCKASIIICSTHKDSRVEGGGLGVHGSPLLFKNSQSLL